MSVSNRVDMINGMKLRQPVSERSLYNKYTLTFKPQSFVTVFHEHTNLRTHFSYRHIGCLLQVKSFDTYLVGKQKLLPFLHVTEFFAFKLHPLSGIACVVEPLLICTWTVRAKNKTVITKGKYVKNKMCTHYLFPGGYIRDRIKKPVFNVHWPSICYY
jgi:hypothetical protein